MLVEKKLSEALKDYDKGKKVLVLTTMMDGSISCDKLEDLFPEDTHFLVDTPAYVNPEFEHAVQNMMQHRSAPKEDTAEDESEEDDTPPLKAVVKKREAKECDVDLLKKLISEKKTNKEIAEIMGVSLPTLKKWIVKYGLTGKRDPGRKVKTVGRGHNVDRHLCKDCKFRSSKGKGCDYIIITGKQRGCDPEECTVYEKE